MKRHICDRCQRAINDGPESRGFIWQRYTPPPDAGIGNFDLCGRCDTDLVESIQEYDIPGNDTF